MSGGRVPETLDDAAGVLMIAPDVRDGPVSACAALVANRRETIDRAVGVTVCQSPSDWLDAWKRHADPAMSLTCVDVNSKTRSAAAEGSTHQPAATLRTVTDATDLASLGTTLTEIMADADAVDDRVAICLHSLSGLLGYVPRQRVFEFLCTLVESAREHDAVVYAHFDPAGQDGDDETTAEVFSAVCDAVVEFDRNLEMHVR